MSTESITAGQTSDSGLAVDSAHISAGLDAPLMSGDMVYPEAVYVGDSNNGAAGNRPAAGPRDTHSGRYDAAGAVDEGDWENGGETSVLALV